MEQYDEEKFIAFVKFKGKIENLRSKDGRQIDWIRNKTQEIYDSKGCCRCNESCRLLMMIIEKKELTR